MNDFLFCEEILEQVLPRVLSVYSKSLRDFIFLFYFYFFFIFSRANKPIISHQRSDLLRRVSFQKTDGERRKEREREKEFVAREFVFARLIF